MLSINMYFNQPAIPTELFFNRFLQDDRVVPYVLGEKLYEKAAKERESNAGPVEFVSFEEEEALGHTLIYSSKTVPNIIREFVSKSLDSVPEASNGHYNLRQRRSQ